MVAIVASALVASLVSALERRRRVASTLDLDGLVLVGAGWMAMVGIVATVLAGLGAFGATSVAACAGVSAVLVWPWRRARPSWPRWTWRPVLAGLMLLALGLGLRWPLADYPLGGRDQGTYTLRAQHVLREGSLVIHDPVLARATAEQPQRPGPADLRGLVAAEPEPWRRGLYEASYRPGFYVTDAARGEIRGQFFHLHPMLMATAGLVLGPSRVVGVMALHAALALLGLWAVARRLWPRGPWPWLAALAWAVSPLAIWVQRTALSEGPATVLVLAATLAVLRARDGDRRGTIHAAVLLGANAWVRGNGWLAAPVILAAMWLVPRDDRTARWSARLYAGLLAAAVLVHLPTTYPYLHDELLRQLPLPGHPTPGGLSLVTLGGLGAWLGIDGLRGAMARRWPSAGATLHRVAPWALAGLLVLAIGAYLWLRPVPVGRPFSRLDPVMPVVGVVTLGLAGLGLGRALRRWPTQPTGAHAWMLGLSAVVVGTGLLYAQRNLPRADLYYYGRYLVPELLPALLLLAVEGLRGVYEAVAGPGDHARRRHAARGLTLAGMLGLGWSTAGVLVLHPVTRLPEFAGADRVIDHLVERLPPDAIVIAGGEGWHHGHTFNQVGGALALRHGVTVLPYDTREAAYATLHELLVERPAVTGEAAPPVFLLVNEATKDHLRDRGTDQAVRVAALDDLLPPPFVARRIDLVEMILQRLTPTHTELPERVARAGLRMGLMRIEVDPGRLPSVQRWHLGADASGPTITGPGGSAIAIEGVSPGSGAACIGPTGLRIELPPARGASAGDPSAGPIALVLVATPGTAARNHTWQLSVDGTRLGLDPPRRTPRMRDTLGPFALQARPRTIEIHGASTPTPDARCPFGGLAELRLLGPEQAQLRRAEAIEAVSFGPTEDLGHPVEPVAWVSGRGLSRYRRGLSRSSEVEGLTLVLRPDASIAFPVAALPDDGVATLEIVATITRARIGADTRLVIAIDGEPLPPIDPPDVRDGAWQSPATTWQPHDPARRAVRIEARLEGAGPDEAVWLRDIGLFSRGTRVRGRAATP